MASHIPRSAFEPIVLVALIVVGAYVLFKPSLGEVTELRFAGHHHTAAAMAVGLVIGFYDGALGPGTGSFFVVQPGRRCSATRSSQASAKARLANWATNLAALCVFVPQGAVLWKIGLVLGALQPGRRVHRRAGRGLAGEPGSCGSSSSWSCQAFIVRIGGDVFGVW